MYLLCTTSRANYAPKSINPRCVPGLQVDRVVNLAIGTKHRDRVMHDDRKAESPKVVDQEEPILFRISPHSVRVDGLVLDLRDEPPLLKLIHAL